MLSYVLLLLGTWVLSRFSKLFPHWIGHYGRPLVIDILSMVVILR